jgi:hypothetical protein
MSEFIACHICGRTGPGGLYRACHGRWTCAGCWDNVARLVMARAEAAEQHDVLTPEGTVIRQLLADVATLATR